jgi:hypothetical protein
MIHIGNHTSLHFSRVLYGYVLESQFGALNRARVYGLLWLFARCRRIGQAAIVKFL